MKLKGMRPLDLWPSKKCAKTSLNSFLLPDSSVALKGKSASRLLRWFTKPFNISLQLLMDSCVVFYCRRLGTVALPANKRIGRLTRGCAESEGELIPQSLTTQPPPQPLPTELFQQISPRTDNPHFYYQNFCHHWRNIELLLDSFGYHQDVNHRVKKSPSRTTQLRPE